MMQSLNVGGLSEVLSSGKRLQEYLYHLWVKAALFPTQDSILEQWQVCIADGVKNLSEIKKITELNTGVEQPALVLLESHFDQFVSLGNVLLYKIQEKEPLGQDDYETLALKHRQFMLQLERFEKAFYSAAGHLDPLTGIRTRHGMMRELEMELNRYRRHGNSFCVAICDIDFFKRVNDTYGHDTGDRALQSVAGCLIKSLRSFDEVYRMGGEEFLICLKEADDETAIAVLERLRKAIAAIEIPLIGFKEEILQITASFGVAAAEKKTSIEKMIASADQALYAAKQGGRDQVRLFERS